MKTRLADENTAAAELLPPNALDGSGLGVNYVDAYVKPLNVELDDGRKVKVKRKGLKILLSVGDASGEALLRRLEYGPDPEIILRHGLEEAAASIGMKIEIVEGGVYLVTEAQG